MFTRVKQSRNLEYLQIVQNYRDEGRVRQRMVMYVGHYDSIDHALALMARELPRARRRATVTERYPGWQSESEPGALREEANRLAQKLEELKRFAHEHPDVVERDRARAKRHSQRQREATAKWIEEMARRREDAGR